jgi:acetylornithine/succinyldiaminopimelate/putrescine aminotransferase
MQGLEALQSRFAVISEVRGQGLLIGAALDIEAAPLIADARTHGLLVLSAGPNVLRLLPPLNITAAEVDEALKILATVMENAQ